MKRTEYVNIDVIFIGRNKVTQWGKYEFIALLILTSRLAFKVEKNILWVCFFPRVVETQADVVEADAEVGEEVVEGMVGAEVAVAAAEETVAETEGVDEHPTGSEET